MTFLNLFIICRFKNPNLAEHLTYLAENPKKKLNPTEFMEFGFSMSVAKLIIDLCCYVPPMFQLISPYISEIYEKGFMVNQHSKRFTTATSPGASVRTQFQNSYFLPKDCWANYL